jgi:hypothetical protein
METSPVMLPLLFWMGTLIAMLLIILIQMETSPVMLLLLFWMGTLMIFALLLLLVVLVVFFVRKRSRTLESSPFLFALNNACTAFLDDGRDAAADAGSGSAGDDDNAIIGGVMNDDRDDRDDLRVATEPDRCDDLEPDDACGAAAATG